MQFAANLSMLFTELPLEQRFGAAAKQGFQAVEIQFPYALPPDRLHEVLRANALTLALHNLPAGDWAAGERGIACHPARRDEFRAGLAQAIEYARRLECPRLNCLAGVPPAGIDPNAAWETLVENVAHAAAVLQPLGITLLIEAINTFDVPGFLLGDSRAARELRDRCGSDNLRFQFDAYHIHRMEGDLAASLAANRDWIGHVQIADAPGRHEPGTGEIDFRGFFEDLAAAGYHGWVGCEYVPRSGTAEGLGWMERLAPTDITE